MTKKPWLFRIIWLIALLPLLFAWGLALIGNQLPLDTKNNGELMPAGMTVPQQISDELDGKWGLLMLSQQCNNGCAEQLHRLQQLHTAMGTDLKRVQPLWLSSDMGKDRPDNVNYEQVRSVTAPALIDWFNQNQLDWQDHSFWLVDPAGNLVMRFAPDLNGQKILADIDWLLKASHIG